MFLRPTQYRTVPPADFELSHRPNHSDKHAQHVVMAGCGRLIKRCNAHGGTAHSVTESLRHSLCQLLTYVLSLLTPTSFLPSPLSIVLAENLPPSRAPSVCLTTGTPQGHQENCFPNPSNMRKRFQSLSHLPSSQQTACEDDGRIRLRPGDVGSRLPGKHPEVRGPSRNLLVELWRQCSPKKLVPNPNL